MRYIQGIRFIWIASSRQSREELYFYFVISIVSGLLDAALILTTAYFLQSSSQQGLNTYVVNNLPLQYIFAGLLFLLTISLCFKVYVNFKMTRLIALWSEDLANIVIKNNTLGATSSATLAEKFPIDTLTTSIGELNYSVTFGIINPHFLAINGFWSSFVMTIVLLVYSPIAGIGGSIITLCVYGVIYYYSKKVSQRNSKELSAKIPLLPYNSIDWYTNELELATSESLIQRTNNISRVLFDIRKLQAFSQFLIQLPRIPMDAVIIVTFIIFFIASHASGSQSNNDFQSLTVLALSIQKIGPAVQLIFNAFNSFAYHSDDLSIIHSVALSLPSASAIHEKSEFLFSNRVKPFIKLINVCIVRDNKALFQPINLSIEAPARVAISGPSGIGKTSLLKALIGVSEDFTGSIMIDMPGKDPLSTSCISKQNSGLFYGKLIKSLGAQFESLADLNKRQIEILKALNIDSLIRENYFYDTQNCNLSGGEIQRISIARSLFTMKKLILFDEATNGLDERSVSTVLDLFRQYTNENNAIIINVTHDQRVIDDSTCRLKLKT